MKTQTTLNLKRVSYVKFFYRTPDGTLVRRTKPRNPTVNGKEINKDEFAIPYDMQYPSETWYERASRLYLIDTWIPVCKVYFTMYDIIIYVGDKAIAIHQAYRKMIYAMQ